jgi:hypothetical protein
MRLKLAAGAGGTYPPWAISLPGVLAVVMAALFAVIDLVGVLMGSWDTPMCGLGWLRVGAFGQCGLAVAAVVVLVAGVTHPGWRHDAALTAWGVIALEIGWFLLTRMLVNP